MQYKRLSPLKLRYLEYTGHTFCDASGASLDIKQFLSVNDVRMHLVKIIGNHVYLV